jgi:hypothetical protein
MRDVVKDPLIKEIRNCEQIDARLQALAKLSKEEISDRLFSSSLKCRGINPCSISTLWRDRGDVYLDCSSWVFGDRRLEFIFKHQYREMIFAIEALNILLRNTTLTIYTSDESMKSSLQEFFADGSVVFEPIMNNSLISENLYYEQTTLDLETLMSMISVLEERPSFHKDEELTFPKLISLYGQDVKELTTSVSSHMTYLELVESYGQVSAEPYGLVIDSIVGEFYLWEDIKTMQLSELTTYVGVVHCLSSKEELDALSDKMLLSY